MALERIITPAAYLAGTTDRAILTVRYRDINGKRRSLKVRNVGSYRLRTDGSRFSVRKNDRAGSKNALVLEYRSAGGAVIKMGQGNERVVSDVSLTLAEGTYSVVVA